LKYKRIGFDLDHTLIDYSDSINFLAEQQGFQAKSKEEAKHHYESNKLGDLGWQDFQSALYTDGLRFARLNPGADVLIRRAAAHGTEVFIVSHKTEYANRGSQRTSLRTVASSFLELHGLSPGLVGTENVRYAEDRPTKVSIIRELSLDLFVDDLPEVLENPWIPSNTLKVLYDPGNVHTGSSLFRVCEFSELESFIFDG
jgi:phosphoserine phosphatase